MVTPETEGYTGWQQEAPAVVLHSESWAGMRRMYRVVIVRRIRATRQITFTVYTWGHTKHADGYWLHEVRDGKRVPHQVFKRMSALKRWVHQVEQGYA